VYARLVTFEGATDIDGVAKQIQEGGRPEGVPATAFYLMANRDAGEVVTLSLFETEEDLRTGHETLNAMSPPGGGLGTRATVDLLEVVAHMTA
jgi:hypothetical protein